MSGLGFRDPLRFPIQPVSQPPNRGSRRRRELQDSQVSGVRTAQREVGARRADTFGDDADPDEKSEQLAADAEAEHRLQRRRDGDQRHQDKGDGRRPEGEVGDHRRQRERCADPLGEPLRWTVDGTWLRRAERDDDRVASRPSGLNVGPAATRATNPYASGTSTQVQPATRISIVMTDHAAGDDAGRDLVDRVREAEKSTDVVDFITGRQPGQAGPSRRRGPDGGGR